MRRTLGLALVAAVVAPVAARAEHRARPRPRPWLGVTIAEPQGWGGVAVVDVLSETPASLCGLRAGDTIVAIDDVEVSGTSALQAAVAVHAVGDTVAVSYLRDGDDHRCHAALAAQVTDPTEILRRKVVDRTIPFALLRRDDGAAVDDAASRGHVVVLGLLSTACDGCGATLDDLAARIAAEPGGDAIAVYGVVAEGQQAADAYAQRLAITTPLGLDQGTLVSRYLADRGELTILVVDHEGVVRCAASGPGPDDTHLDSAVFAASRAERVRQKDR